MTSTKGPAKRTRIADGPEGQTMKHRVSELEGALLDAAVAKAEGRPADLVTLGLRLASFEPSTAWADGGPIIERERITIQRYSKGWTAMVGVFWQSGDVVGTCAAEEDGETALIAAMRAYIASKFGDEVELP